jgi:hypothetical protein
MTKIQMELLIENITAKRDRQMLMGLIKRLGFSYRELSKEEKEDMALGKAIEQRTPRSAKSPTS